MASPVSASIVKLEPVQRIVMQKRKHPVCILQPAVDTFGPQDGIANSALPIFSTLNGVEP